MSMYDTSSFKLFGQPIASIVALRKSILEIKNLWICVFIEMLDMV